MPVACNALMLDATPCDENKKEKAASGDRDEDTDTETWGLGKQKS